MNELNLVIHFLKRRGDRLINVYLKEINFCKKKREC